MLITYVRRHERTLILAGLVGISLVVAGDMYVDLADGLPLSHLIHEALILVFCLFLTLIQWRVISGQRRQLGEKETTIRQLTESREEFRRRSLRFSGEFAAAVSQQFEEWELTESERDVALLLIKGLSMKEIADSRASKETTVRQQAAVIYRKARVEGRQELAAYFLEDLFAPVQSSKSQS
mgnify:CR=1 FL=1